MDPNLNDLLKWSVSATTNPETATADPQAAARSLNYDALASLLSPGPSAGDQMKDAMAAIKSDDPSMTLEARLIAFDNFEQLIENLDNANLIASLHLWPDLISCLHASEPEIRFYAAWCMGTAVQNNAPSQIMLVKEGGIKPLVDVALGEQEEQKVRLKAIYALSSALRNMQEAVDEFGKVMKVREKDYGYINAADMDQIDTIINGLKEKAAQSKVCNLQFVEWIASI